MKKVMQKGPPKYTTETPIAVLAPEGTVWNVDSRLTQSFMKVLALPDLTKYVLREYVTLAVLVT